MTKYYELFQKVAISKPLLGMGGNYTRGTKPGWNKMYPRSIFNRLGKDTYEVHKLRQLLKGSKKKLAIGAELAGLVGAGGYALLKG